MFDKVPRTYGSSDSPEPTPTRRSTIAIERMERAARNRVRIQAGALLLGPLLGALLAVGYVFSKPPLYEAAGRIRMVPSSLQAPPPPGLPPGYTYYGPNVIRPNARADELQILTSRTFLHSVALTLSKPQQERLLEDDLDGYTPEQLNRALVANLSDGLTIEGNQIDELFEISFEHENPELAAEIVNQIIKSAQEVGLRLGEERNRRAATFFAGQILTLKDQIRGAQARAKVIELGSNERSRNAQRNAGADYKFEIGGGDPDPELAPLTKAADSARLEQRLAQAEVHLLETLGKEDATATKDIPELEKLRRDLHVAQAEYAALGATLGPSAPQMRGRAAAIARYEQLLANATEQRLQSARYAAGQAARNVQTLDAETERHRKALASLVEEQVRDAMLEIDLALNLSVYEAIQAKLQEAKINAGLGATDLQIIDQADPPDKPLPRNLVFPMGIGMALGLLLGSLCAVYFIQRGQRRWSVEGMEGRTRLPALTILANQGAGGLSGEGNTLPAEFEDGMRILANEVRLLPRSQATTRLAEVILFTSAAPSEGKTATICSYAMQAARQGQRVLLLDADMHRPAVHKFFRLSGRHGLSSVLSGRMAAADALQTVASAPGMDVLVGGPVPPSPSDLLARHGFVELLDDARAKYDLILIDSPPVLALMDSVTMSQEVDVVLLVTRYGVVTLTQAARAMDLLGRANARVGGLVVNGAPVR